MRKPCCEKEGINKGAWSKQEDQKLIDHIKRYGEGCWRSLPKSAGLQRCGKSCRLRWINYLRPDIKRGDFAKDEEDLIIKLHALLGNRWSLIAGRLPGRTDNEVKNYWNSHLKKKLLRMGIDPNKHKPHHHFPPTSSTPNQLRLADHHPGHAAAAGATTTTTTTSSFSDDRSLLNVVVDQSVSCCHTSSEQPLDLNLELTIATIPSHEHEKNGTAVDHQLQQIASTNTTTDAAAANYHVEAAARQLSPTLLLFN